MIYQRCVQGQVTTRHILCFYALILCLLSAFICGLVCAQTDEIAAGQEFTSTEMQLKQLASIMRSAPTGIGIVENRVFTQVNDYILELTGYSREELIGKSARMVYPTDEDYEYVGREKYRQISERGTGTVETRWLRKDGSIRKVILSSTPLDLNNLDVGVTFTVLDITERRNAEEEARLQAQRYREIVEFAVDGIGIASADGRITDGNSSLERILGLKREEVLGKSLSILFPQDEIEHQPLRFDLLQAGETVVNERMIKRADGAVIWVETHTKQLPDGSYQAIFRDITGRKLTREKIAQSARQLQELIEQAVDGIIMGDAEGRITSANTSAVRILGIKESELIGQHVSSFFSPEVLEQKPLRFDLLVQGQTVVTERELERPDGRKIYIEMHTKIMPDGSYQSFIRDNTERRQAEDRIRESSEFTNSLLRAIPVAVFFKDKNGRYLGCNKTFTEIMGVASEDIQGKTVQELWPDEHALTYHQHDLELINTGQYQSYEFKVKDKDDQERPVLFAKDIFRNAAGEVKGMVGAFVDLTEIKKAEAAEAALYSRTRLFVKIMALALLLQLVVIGYLVKNIRARRRAMRELREKTAELDRYFESSLDLLCIADTDGHFRRLNPEWAFTLGYSLAELEGKCFLDFVHPDDLDKTKAALASSAAQKRIFNLENRYRCKDGSYRWIEWRSHPVGKMIYSVARDITKRNAAEIALRESEGKLSALFAAMTEMVVLHEVVFDDEGKPVNYRITDCNTAFCEITGISRENAIGYLATEVYQVKTAPYLQVFTAVGITGKACTFETLYPPMNRHFLISVVSPEKNKFATITTDITERKQAEDALREARQLLRNVLDTVPVRVFWKDPEGRYLGCNLPFAKDAGHENPQDLIGKDDFEMGWKEQAELYRADDRKVFESGQAKLGYEEFQISPDGKYIWLLTNKIPLKDYTGRKIGVLGTYEDITEQREQREALRRSEENLSITLNSIGDAVIATDIESRVTKMNPIACRLTGWQEADAAGRPLQEVFNIVNAQTGAPATDPVAQVLETGKIVGLANHTMLLAKDGAKYQIADSAAPIHDRENKTIGVVLVFRDVTDEYAMREALEQERAQLLSLFDSIDAPIYVADMETGEILYANNAIQKEFKKPLIGKTCYKALHGLDAECAFCTNAKIRELNYEPYRWEHHNEKLQADFQIIDRVIKWPDGRDVRFEIAIDITARKRAEEMIAAEKERLAVTLRSIGDGVITTDMEGRVLLINRVGEELTGWRQEEAAGRALTEIFSIIHEHSRKPCENPVTRVLATGEIIELENHTLLISRDGTERVIADSGAPIKDKTSSIVGVVLVFRDMTEKQRLLDEVHKSQHLEALGVLAGGIAHDFNNLLGGIFGCIEIARLENRNREVAERLDEALGAMDRARALTRELLTFAKGGAPVKAVQNLFPAVQDAVQFSLRGSNVACSFNIPSDLWACMFDNNQICQVMDNLAINARQAMAEGGTLEISAENIVIDENEHPCLQPGHYVKISVCDNGPGIALDLQQKIFDPFFSTKKQGHGLGLSTSYSIVDKHGGVIEVESEPEKGATFHVYLPAAAAEIPLQTAKKKKKHRGKGCFLVMDDEPLMEEVMRQMLGMFGYTVMAVPDGADAIRVFKDETEAGRGFVGAFLDLTVPGGMGGVETAGILKNLAPELPLFVMSGYSDDAAIAAPEDYGFTGSLCKPFTIQELEAVLSQCLE